MTCVSVDYGGAMIENKMEEWKIIENFPSYEVSSLGRVRNLKTGKIRKPVVHHSGYLQLNLVKEDGSKKTVYIHRVVAFAFCNPPKNWKELTVNHKDGNKENVEATNLEWISMSDNLKHARLTGLNPIDGEMNGRALLTAEQVLWIRNVYIPRDKEFGQKALAEKFNVSKATISHIITRRTWTEI